jgi:hypothetical protein
MKKRYVVLVMMMVLCYCSLLPATTYTWNVKDDMVFTHTEPLGTNPNGAWTYGSVPELADRNVPITSNLDPFDKSFAEAGTGNPWWQYDPVWYAAIPAVWLGAAYGSAADAVGMHPGYNAGGILRSMAVIRWTAPAGGRVEISGAWFAGAEANKRDLYIVKNETEALMKVLDDVGTSILLQKPLFDPIFCVHAGDTLDFAVGVGSDGGGGSDSESLELIISLNDSIDPNDPNQCDPNWDPNNVTDANDLDITEPNLDPNATSWDFHEDLRFTKGNPTYFWAYGTASVPVIYEPNDPGDPPARWWDADALDTTTLVLYDEAYNNPSYSIPLWHYDTLLTERCPQIFKNTSPVSVYSCPAGKSALIPASEPANIEDVSVARWIAPRAGKYLAKGTFFAGGSGKNDYFIIQNGTTQLFQQLDSGSNGTFKLLLTLAQYDTIDFVVGAGLDGSTRTSDATPLDVSITENPTCQDVGEYHELDFNEDCYINLADFAVFAQDWLWCNDPTDPECPLE